jgi:hypothetical protein
MDILSILLFFIYSLIILVILVYISPLLSALIMILVPVACVYILPEETISFLSAMQFSYAGVQIYNLHILLLIWSAFIGIIAYAEVVTWYLLRETIVKETVTNPVKNEALPVHGEHPETFFFKVKDFLEKLIKILKGEKIKSKP